MGYVQHKYTKAYFLREDEAGEPTGFGAIGADLYKNENGRPREFDKQMLDQLDPAGCRVLDLGCGRGEAAKDLKQRGATRLIAVDFSQDACELAGNLFQKNNLDIELHCEDGLEFVRHIDERAGADAIFDIVTMLDFVEHVPRQELAETLRVIVSRMTPQAIVILNTPIFPVDNDVLTEGLKEEARDSSDQFEQTFGMHCNRYTLESLKAFMASLGLVSVAGSGHFYVKAEGLSKSEASTDSPETNVSWDALKRAGYPVNPNSAYTDEYEYAGTIDLPGASSGTSSQAEAGSGLGPDIDPKYLPVWQTFQGGQLAGYSLYAPPAHDWMIDGSHEAFIFESARDLDLDGKLFIDVGGHIGYHCMAFATMVGTAGRVLSVEPNRANVERMQLNLSRNPELADRIDIVQSLAGAKAGIEEFCLSSEIDNGHSSGGFIAGTDTPTAADFYESKKFHRTMIPVRTLDEIYQASGDGRELAAIKIDVEGAEAAVLEGAREIIQEFKPALYVELHGIIPTLEVFEFFSQMGYRAEFLEDLAENRAFVHAAYDPGLDDPVRARDAMEETLHEAIKRSIEAVRRRDEDSIRTLQEKNQEIKSQTQAYEQLQAQAQNLARSAWSVLGLAERVNRSRGFTEDLDTIDLNTLAQRVQSATQRLERVVKRDPGVILFRFARLLKKLLGR